jgi:ATP-dependent exoDNAse (exonuclease V) beta subunit
MFIGEKTRNKIVDLIRKHLEEHAAAIDVAFTRAEKAMYISIGIKLSENPKDSNAVDVGTSISFKVDQIKDTAYGTVTEHQMSLPGLDQDA